MKENIILIGFMGSGKSSIGIRLARRLHRTFVDTSREIEKVTGMSLVELFRRHGEIRFHSEETLLLEKLMQQENLVIAAGGSVLLDAENSRIFGRNHHVVCLKASPEDILNRLNRKKGTRPRLKKTLTIQELEAWMQDYKFYEELADFTVYTGGKLQEQIVDEIIECLNKRNFYVDKI